jgi:urea transport system permease protein
MAVNAAKSWFTGAFPTVWLFALGALFVVVTLFLPKGIVGTLADLCEASARAAGPPTPAPSSASDVKPAE